MPLLTTGAGAYPSLANSTAYTNFAARCVTAGATLTGSDITNYSNLLNGLTTDGLFNSNGTSSFLDALYVFAAPSATVALLDLTNNAFNCTVPNTTPTFSAYAGYTGADGSGTVYLSTGYNPTVNAINYSQNSASIGAWSNTNLQSGASGGCSIGYQTAAGSISDIFPKYSTGLAYYRINDPQAGPSAGVSNSDSTGFYVANRSGASAQQGYRNAVDQGVVAVTSHSLSSGTIPICGLATPANSFGDSHQLSVAFIGGNLSSTNVTNLYNRLATYRTAVGL